MTREQLATLGEALCGPTWQRELARRLGISDRAMRRYVAGVRDVPDDIAERTVAMCVAHSQKLAKLARTGGR